MAKKQQKPQQKSPFLVQKILKKEIGSQKDMPKVKGAKQLQGFVHFPARFGTLTRLQKLLGAKGMIMTPTNTAPPLRDMVAYTVFYQAMPVTFPSIPKFRRRMEFGVQAMTHIHSLTVPHPCLYTDIPGDDVVLQPLVAGMYTLSPTPVYFTVYPSLVDYKVLTRNMLKNIDVMIRVEKLLYALAVIGYDPSDVSMMDIVYHSKTLECKILKLSNIKKQLPPWRIQKAKDALKQSTRRDFEQMWPAPSWMRSLSSNILSSKRLEAYAFSETQCPLFTAPGNNG
jgi:hypothetical protein